MHKMGIQIRHGNVQFYRGFAWDQIKISAQVNTITKMGVILSFVKLLFHQIPQ